MWSHAIIRADRGQAPLWQFSSNFAKLASLRKNITKRDSAMQRQQACQKLLDAARKLIPFGSYNKGLSNAGANALFKQYCESLIGENTIEGIEKSKLRSLIAHHQFYQELRAIMNTPAKGDPIAVIAAHLQMAKIMITYGAGNCGVAAVVLYFALKEEVFPLEYAHISEEHQIIVIGRTDMRAKLSLKEVRNLDDNIFGICAYTGYVFQMNKLFHDEHHLAFCDPKNLKTLQPLQLGVGVGDDQFVFRCNFQLGGPEVTSHPSIKAIMQQINEIPKMTAEKAKIEHVFFLQTHNKTNAALAFFNVKSQDDLIDKLAEAMKIKPRLASILSIVSEAPASKAKYNLALRTAANDDVDGLVAVKILLSFKKLLGINVDEVAGANERAAIHLAILKKNWDVVEELIEQGGASSSLRDKTGLCADTSDYPKRKLSFTS